MAVRNSDGCCHNAGGGAGPSRNERPLLGRRAGHADAKPLFESFVGRGAVSLDRSLRAARCGTASGNDSADSGDTGKHKPSRVARHCERPSDLRCDFIDGAARGTASHG